jgi:GTP-binding protein
MFIDYAEIDLKAGKGGDGAVTFRREKYVPKGGPSGGNGGNGGNIIVQAHHNLSTLLDFRYKKHYKADNGEIGGSSLKDGKNGKDIIIKVPVGTIIKDADTKKILFDLDEDNKQVIIAKGGKGGKGNSNFATPTKQAPRFAEEGRSGEDFQSFTVADIPGIIEGAHMGKGLGHKFLRHIERTKILLFLIDITSDDYQRDYDILLNELKSYSKKLAEKLKIVALSKSDIAGDKKIKKKIKNADSPTLVFSSITNQGLNDLVDYLWFALQHSDETLK